MRPWRESNLTAIALAVAMWFMCLLLACGGPTALSHIAGSSLRQDGPVALIPMCAWARHGAVGLWWNSSVTPARAFSNAHRYNALCVAVPWSTQLPARGRPAVDVTP